MSIITEPLKQFFSLLHSLRPSPWRLINGTALSTSVTPSAGSRFSLDAIGGVISIQQDGHNQIRNLLFAGIGGGVNLELEKVTPDFDLTLDYGPSYASKIRFGRLSGGFLSLSDFEGKCAIIDIGAGLLCGVGLTIIFFGIPGFLPNITFDLFDALIGNYKAVVIQAGTNQGILAEAGAIGHTGFVRSI